MLLHDFFFDLEQPLWSLSPEFLLHWLCIWLQWQSVYHYLEVEADYVIITPGKDVCIFPEESQEFYSGLGDSLALMRTSLTSSTVPMLTTFVSSSTLRFGPSGSSL